MTAFGVLVGCGMKNNAVFLYFKNIRWILLCHYGQELLIEIGVYCLDSCYEPDIQKRFNFFQWDNIKTIVYATYGNICLAFVTARFFYGD